MSWGAVIVGGASLVSGYMSSKSAGDSADAQMQAAQDAAAVQKAMYESNKELLMPYIQAGSGQVTPEPSSPRMSMPVKPETVRATSTARGYAHQAANEQNKQNTARYDSEMARYEASQTEWDEYEIAKESDGGGSLQLQQAYSGALGPEAQQQAFDDYAESPGVTWQREQGLRGVEAGLGATGAGGGTRLKAISEYNQGLAMQDFSNQFNRLGSITNVGLSAASALSGVGTSSAAGQAEAITQSGQAEAGGVLGRSAAFSSGLSGIAGAAGQYMNTPTAPSNYSGIAGVNQGSQQDYMLAQQNAGF